MKIKKYVLLYLFSRAICATEIGYDTIYLLKFDNLKNDFPYSHMEEALPDLIRENYEFRQDLTIKYIENINPNIEKYAQSNEDLVKAIIINGRFQVVNNNFHIEYEAYDMESWQQLIKRHFFCPLHDVACVHDAFIISMENNLSPFLVDRLDIENTIMALEKAEKEKVKNIDVKVKLNKMEDDSNYFFIEEKNYREFNIKDIKPEIIKRSDSLQNLSNILLQVLNTPYEVFIGDMEIELHDINLDSYKVKLPIRYSMMNIIKPDLLASLPLNSYLNTNEEVIFQFSSDDFIIDDYFKENMVQTKFQKFPVIYFLDKVGQPQFIAIDTWLSKDLFNNVKINDLPVYVVNKFMPLFSITSGVGNVELSINTRVLDLRYDFLIPNENMDDYVKVVVKFIQRDEIEKLSEK